MRAAAGLVPSGVAMSRPCLEHLPSAQLAGFHCSKQKPGTDASTASRRTTALVSAGTPLAALSAPVPATKHVSVVPRRARNASPLQSFLPPALCRITLPLLCRTAPLPWQMLHHPSHPPSRQSHPFHNLPTLLHHPAASKVNGEGRSSPFRRATRRT